MQYALKRFPEIQGEVAIRFELVSMVTVLWEMHLIFSDSLSWCSSQNYLFQRWFWGTAVLGVNVTWEQQGKFLYHRLKVKAQAGIISSHLKCFAHSHPFFRFLSFPSHLQVIVQVVPFWLRTSLYNHFAPMQILTAKQIISPWSVWLSRALSSTLWKPTSKRRWLLSTTCQVSFESRQTA